MYKLLMGLMLIAAAQQLGLNLKDISGLHGRSTAARIERASRNVLRIDWKPISVFPSEAKRFQ